MNQQNTQANPVALITGAGRRIGAAIAQYLHQKGFSVVIHCKQSIESATLLSNELNRLRPNSAKVLVTDLAQKALAEQLIRDALLWAGRLDVLVNNASLFIATPQGEVADVVWDSLFTIHVKAPFWLSQAAFPHLQASGGSIVNITDTHADKPLKNYAIYCQSKAALAMQTKVLARDFAPHVRVNAVAPGAVVWPEGDNKLTDEKQHQIIEKTLLHQHGDPVFVAQAVFSLIENPFITAQTLSVDGGRG